MLRSLNAAVSGLQNFQEEMDVIGNNIANVNTTGYKAAHVSFADSFSDTLQYSTGATANSSGAAAIQVGMGVTTAAINNDFTQGAYNRTNKQTDLAISGNGYYMVKNSVTGVEYATRDGSFQIDGNGYLVTNSGERVQGYSDSGLTTIGDVRIDTTGAPATSAGASMLSYAVDNQGRITVSLSDQTSFVRGQILMQSFQAPNALVKEGNNLYSGISAAGPLGGTTPTPAAPETNGLGKIVEGALELSNVDLSNEMANLITAQRAFEANAKIITTSDEMLQTLVNLKR